MLRIQNLSGFGSGRPPSSSSTLDKPSEPDHAYSFYDYERVSGLLKLTDIIGSVDLYANADLFDGVFVGSTVGGKRDDQLQVQRASRLIENRLALYGMGADWTATLWFNLKDDAATSATFEIIRVKTSSPGYEVAVKARRIDTGDNVGQYEVFCVVNNTEQTILNVSPNAYHFCALRADSGTITVDINSTNAEVTASAGGATQIDYLFLSSESQFDASTSSINFDELYIWTGATLTDGSIAYILNAGIGRFVDRLTGRWEGTVLLSDPGNAWLVGAASSGTDTLQNTWPVPADHTITGSGVTNPSNINNPSTTAVATLTRATAWIEYEFSSAVRLTSWRYTVGEWETNNTFDAGLLVEYHDGSQWRLADQNSHTTGYLAGGYTSPTHSLDQTSTSARWRIRLDSMPFGSGGYIELARIELFAGSIDISTNVVSGGYDLSISGNVSAVHSVTSRQIDYVAAFNNVTPHKLQTPSLTQVLNPAFANTVSCWFRLDNHITSAGYFTNDLFALTEASNGNEHARFDMTPGASGSISFSAIYRYASGTHSAGSAIGNPQGQWNHLVVVADNPNDEIYFYLNGSLFAQTSASLAYSGAANQIKLISDITDLSANARLHIDELYAWDEALSATEIAALYNNGNGKFVGLDGKF